MKKTFLELTPYYRTALGNGTLVPNALQHMTTEGMLFARKGDGIHLCVQAGGPDYLYSVALYTGEIPKDYIYTYAYAPESNWVTYTQNVTPDSYFVQDYIFAEDCYYRICVKRADGQDISDTDIELKDSLIELTFDGELNDRMIHSSSANQTLDVFSQEIEDTCAKVKGISAKDTMSLMLLTDSHFAVNGTWDDTVRNMMTVCNQVKYDAVIHLGDFTDGMVSKELTTKYVRHMLEGMEAVTQDVYVALGNHDHNYFRNNGRAFVPGEIVNIYSTGVMKEKGRKSPNVTLTNGLSNDAVKSKPMDYYVDLEQGNRLVRMIFLESFDNQRAIRYGYDETQIVWLKEVLKNATKGTYFMVFSHDAPLTKLDYWSDYILNGHKLVEALDEINASPDYHVVGMFYGHTHADQITTDASFPLISICCNKMEYFTEKKPAGSTCWEREVCVAKQDCWDNVVIDFDKEKISLIRFGAGEDRCVSFRKKESYKETLNLNKAKRKTKVWGHRGSSGYAPENTLPAFAMAVGLGADGIELDVQLTKDGEMVVIHDERVDRTTDGTGRVVDYTLAELKKLNANNGMNRFGFVEIPTLQEVFELVKDTDLYINLELKNSVIFYEKLEEKVLKLVREMELEDRIIYSSFNHNSMLALKSLSPESKIAFLYSNGILDMDDYAVRYQAAAVHPSVQNMRYPNSDFVARCHEKGILVNVWTANEQKDIDYLKSIGVDAVITNYIDRCID